MGLFDWFFGMFSGSKKEIKSRLYVGNLSYKARETDIKLLFSRYGIVKRVSIIKDRHTRKPKGYAFVEFANQGEAKKALEFDHTQFMGRTMNVSKANPPKNDRSDRPSRSGSRSNYRGRGRGRQRVSR